MSLDSDHLPEVREQYERLPYPPCDPEDDNRRLVTTWLDDLPMINHYRFGGEQSFQRGFRVLIAGGDSAAPDAIPGPAGDMAFCGYAENGEGL
jgi:hypothetical protein